MIHIFIVGFGFSKSSSMLREVVTLICFVFSLNLKTRYDISEL